MTTEMGQSSFQLGIMKINTYLECRVASSSHFTDEENEVQSNYVLKGQEENWVSNHPTPGLSDLFTRSVIFKLVHRAVGF